MPRYCFKNEDGDVIARVYRMGKAPKSFTLKGKKFTRDIRSEHCSHVSVAGNWPQHSDAAGVAVSQIKDASRKMAEAGCPTEFDSQGRAIFTSRGHRNRALRVMGMYDRNAGYGDPAPINK